MGFMKFSKDTKQRKLSTIGFSLFFGWLLAVPFEGQILYTLMEQVEPNGINHNTIAVFFHFIGLFISGIFIKKQVAAKITVIISTVVCLSGSLIFFLPFSALWYISLMAISFFAGLAVAGWGFYYKKYSIREQRIKTAADVLIYSNILMIACNVLAMNLSAFMGLTLSIIALLVTLIIFFRLDAHPSDETYAKKASNEITNSTASLLKPFAFLCVFIVVITINSGIMYQVVVPAFSHFTLLTSYYWAIPYIVALLILRNIPERINRAYILFIALTMIGLSFIAFMWLDRSIGSYLIINTLMLGAFGVCDLFWWSILGGLFDYGKNPAQILGVGLSMNVLGVLLGGIIGGYIISGNSDYFETSIIAIVIVFVVIIMLPALNTQLTKLLGKHVYLVRFSGMEESEQKQIIADFIESKQLTEREVDIVKLLLKGFTYKAISDSLYISENTTKFHIKNIYQKLNISNKMELIRMFTESAKNN